MDDPRFQEYLQVVRNTTSFFRGVEEGTPAWQARVKRAHEKYLAKLKQQTPNDQPTTGSPSPSSSSSIPATDAASVPAARPAAKSTTSSSSTATATTAASPLSAADIEAARELKTKANKQFSEGSYEAAADLYSRAIEKDPTSAVLFSNRAACWLHLEKLPLAEKDARKAVQLDPNYRKAFTHIGNSLFRQGKFDQAISDGYQPALSLEPNNSALLEDLQRADEARKDKNRTGSTSGSTPGRAPPAAGGPNLSNLFSMFGGGGGAGGAGGAGADGGPLAGLAQSMADDPELQNMMSDPEGQRLMDEISRNPMSVMQHMNHPIVQRMMQKVLGGGAGAMPPH